MRARPMFGTTVLAVAMWAVALLGATSAPAAPPAGALTAVAGPGGCLTAGPTAPGCSAVRMLLAQDMPTWVFSPDGRQAIGVHAWPVAPLLNVNPRPGRIRQPVGPAGCLGFGCAEDLGIGATEGMQDLQFSPSGDRLYVLVDTSSPPQATSPDATAVRLLAFSRDPGSGALQPLPQGRGCLAPFERAGCATAPELGDARDIFHVTGLRLAADGRSLTILGTRLVTVALDAGGGLTAPVSSCQAPATIDGRRAIVPCGAADDFKLASWFDSDDILVGPGGTHAYVESTGSWDLSDLDSGRTVLYDRDPATGALSDPRGAYACATPNLAGACLGLRLAGRPTLLDGPLFTSQGAAVVLAAYVRRAALIGYAADPVTGLLRQRTCLSVRRHAGCRRARGLALPADQGLSLSPDGRSAYVAGGFDYEGNDFSAWAKRALTSFRLDPSSGVLRQLPGAAGCMSPERDPPAGCARVPDTAGHARCPDCLEGTDPLQPVFLAPVITPDGRNVYVNDTTSILAFTRDPATGTLRRLPGRAWCVRGSARSAECRHVGQLTSAQALRLSPDGRFLTSMSPSSVVQLRRATG